MGASRARSSVDRFLLLYALAWAGGSISYTPLLTLLLPARVMDLAGTSAGVNWLAYMAFAGAVSASAGNILFGYLSDVTRERRLWVVSGFVLSIVLLNLFGRVTDLATLLGLIVCWQLALNMMLGPLAAWAADRVPDDRKGFLGGLMAFAPALGGLAGVIVTAPVFDGITQRLVMLALIVAMCILPLIIMAGPAFLVRPPGAEPMNTHASATRFLTWRMWIARFAVQITEATMFAYLLVWLKRLDPATTDNEVAWLFSFILFASAPLALLAGSWSDRRSDPIRPLVVCAMVAALGLLGMTLVRHAAEAALAYGIFGIASAMFLALHSAQTLRVLPRSARRGLDLGLFNLTNTTPSLIMPWIAMALIPAVGFAGLFAVLSLLSAAASLALIPAARRTAASP